MSRIKLRKINTNTDLVKDLMSFGPHGHLSELFVVEAIRKIAEGTAKWTDEQVAEYQAKNGLISMEAWRATARDIKARCDEFYNRK